MRNSPETRNYFLRRAPLSPSRRLAFVPLTGYGDITMGTPGCCVPKQAASAIASSGPLPNPPCPATRPQVRNVAPSSSRAGLGLLPLLRAAVVQGRRGGAGGAGERSSLSFPSLLLLCWCYCAARDVAGFIGGLPRTTRHPAATLPISVTEYVPLAGPPTTWRSKSNNEIQGNTSKR